MPNLSNIISQLEAQRNQTQRELARLEAAIAALRGLKASGGSGKTNSASTHPRRIMSVAARKKIAAAQRARWAAWKAKQKKAA